ncbi:MULTISPECIES: phosphotransferase [unclassified Bacillus (in: firmicutes)]|uniref:phosphotransferase enzyme family protein n=1 Tax=unclassified Bacillus (in: firmicutes) TaxID=185979 RepID=UPI001BEBD58C|nr:MULTISPECIES: phosphotransferase [unclassified Bacillus (in: firmicutes)]MBT2637359.1 phosphotransferase [Bacillus sp. ISL-39]MBT2660432.1 phosphotransferase [Bacillus sp. ISL-45]
MEKAVSSLMNQEILNDFLDRFGLEREVKKLGDFENYVFETYRNGHPYIMRLTHSSHRSKDEVLSELDWIRHLNNQGLSVPEVFPSKNGLLAEEILAEDRSEFYGCLFAKAPGAAVSVRSEKFNEELFEKWGETTGRMHQATKSYKPSEDIKARSSWDEDELLSVEKYYPSDERVLVENAKEVIAAISVLPINMNNYGIIHTDIHSGNFFYDGEQIHVFDFDDASYHWFASDIAIPLYYSILYRIPASEEEERNRFGKVFLNAFIEGYQKANLLPDGWKKQVPLFLMLRDIVLYAVLHKKIAPEDRDEKLKGMMDEIAVRIRSKQPIVNIG